MGVHAVAAEESRFRRRARGAVERRRIARRARTAGFEFERHHERNAIGDSIAAFRGGAERRHARGVGFARRRDASKVFRRDARGATQPGARGARRRGDGG